jgi:hypothetical protein
LNVWKKEQKKTPMSRQKIFWNCVSALNLWKKKLNNYSYRTVKIYRSAADGNGSCCVYKPKVQIKDNWGWCNGSCPGHTGGGCYNMACDVNFSPNEPHWTSFQGQVIVVPK